MAERVAIRTCPLCEATCGLEVTVDDAAGSVLRVRGDGEDVFSRGFLCPKGVALQDLHEDPRRLRTPLVRDAAGELRPASWDEAFAEIDRRLTPVLADGDRDAVAVYLGNPSAHSLSSLLYNRVLLKALGTKSVYSASTVDQYPKQVASGLMFGTAASVPVPDLDRTDFLLVMGANPYASNGSLMTAPDVRGRLRAIRARGGTVVVADPKRTRTAEAADRWLPLRPGTDALLLLGVLHVLFAEGLAVELDPALFSGTEAVRELAAGFAPAGVAPACGLAAEDVLWLARALAAAPSAAVYGRIGTTTQRHGTVTSWLIDVVNAVTGNLDRPGGAMWTTPAAGSPNTTGSGPVGRGVALGRWRSRVRGLPEVLGELPVATLADEIETPGPGQVRALIVNAGNPVMSTPNSERLDAALAGLECLVSLDLYVQETNRHAHVVLPAPSPLQKWHYDVALYAFAVRDVANVSPPVLPLEPGALDEWEVLLRLTGIVTGQGPSCDVAAVDAFVAGEAARRAGVDLAALPADRVGPARMLDVLLRSGPHGLTLDELLAAPHGVDLGPLKPRLPEVLRTPSGTVELAPPVLVEAAEALGGELGAPTPELVLVGRRHLRSNNSWMNGLARLAGGPDRTSAQVAPEDAARLGLVDGGRAVITSRAGSLEVEVSVSDALRPGVVSLPHGWSSVNSNVLTDEHEVETVTGTAVLNGIPITMVPVAAPEPALA